MNKQIGMCCACGRCFSKSQTVLYNGFEYCLICAEQLGYDGPEEEWEEDDDEEQQ